MADGAASSQESLEAAARGRRATRPDRLPVKLVSGQAPPQRWALPVMIGMPQLGGGGLSETWTLKEGGHRHWMMLGQAIDRAAPDFEDEQGRRIYAAFTGVALEEADFSAVREGDLLVFAGEIRRISQTQFMSEQSISVDGRVLGKLRMISVFLRRGQARRNRSVERAMLRQMPPFRGLPEPQGFAATAYAFRTEAWEAFDGFRRLDRRVLRSFAIDPCPQADFNGAELLYFASLQSFVDRAEWAWFRYADPVAVTRRRHLFFYGNIELGDTLDIRLCGVTRGARHCAHWCEIIRQSDGARIADVMTERLLAG